MIFSFNCIIYRLMDSRITEELGLFYSEVHPVATDISFLLCVSGPLTRVQYLSVMESPYAHKPVYIYHVSFWVCRDDEVVDTVTSTLTCVHVHCRYSHSESGLPAHCCTLAEYRVYPASAAPATMRCKV